MKIIFSRQAISGFSGSELKQMQTREPVVTLYLDAEELLPVKIIGQAKEGSAILLIKENQ